jgi:hypothetical protein
MGEVSKLGTYSYAAFDNGGVFLNCYKFHRQRRLDVERLNEQDEPVSCATSDPAGDGSIAGAWQASGQVATLASLRSEPACPGFIGRLLRQSLMSSRMHTVARIVYAGGKPVIVYVLASDMIRAGACV